MPTFDILICGKWFRSTDSRLADYQSISWGFALAEVAVILASHFEQYELSKIILSKLVFSGRPENIRMTKWFVVGSFLATMGGYIRWECYSALGRLFTFEMSIRDDHRLVTGGPYGWVRHPGYTSVLSTFIGLGIWHATKVGAIIK
jgi:protein-S-isoprenylcysteine O-methyltransferase Ste14